jgi:hypothetical protein
MIEPSLALGNAIYQRLAGSMPVLELVDPFNIRDGATRPDNFPSIIIGDGQTVLEGDQYPGCLNVTVHLDIHIWTFEEGLAGAKAIVGTVWPALMPRLVVPGWRLSDGHHITGVRYLRDPSEQHGHAVISLSAFMSGAWN